MVHVVSRRPSKGPAQDKCVHKCPKPNTVRNLIEPACKINSYWYSQQKLISELPRTDCSSPSIKNRDIDNCKQPYTDGTKYDGKGFIEPLWNIRPPCIVERSSNGKKLQNICFICWALHIITPTQIHLSTHTFTTAYISDGCILAATVIAVYAAKFHRNSSITRYLTEP